jgi:Putative zinc binding domain
MSTECKVCACRVLELAIDLGSRTWCNHFIKPADAGSEPFYPLRVVWCSRCKAAQLDFTVKKEILYGDHTYLSGITKTLNEHFQKIAHDIDHSFMGDWLNSCVACRQSIL